ncbi:MAG: hypothetical protein KC609_02865 [Myxococcales bacterium]|nr:hypothetical protein [Myxococcales bacterium]
MVILGALAALVLASVSCRRNLVTVYAPFPAVQRSLQRSNTRVRRVPATVRDPSRYFRDVLGRDRRELLPLGTLYCVGRDCDREWDQLAARFGADLLHVRCGIADARAFESERIVTGPLVSRRIPKLALPRGGYGCTGVPFVDLRRSAQRGLSPELRVLLRVLTAAAGWRETLMWARQKYRERFTAEWFVASASLVGRLSGPLRELAFLHEGLIHTRGDATIARVLEARRLLHDVRRAVIAEPGLQWVARVLRVSSQSARPGEDAAQLIGPPGPVPGTGYFKRAWTSAATPKPSATIEVEYRRAVRCDGARVVETLVPIEVRRVMLRDAGGSWHVVWRGGTFGKPTLAGRVHLVRFPATRFRADAMRVELRGYSPFNRIEVEALAIHAAADRQ